MSEPRPRHDGWSTARRIDFIRALARHGGVTRAAGEVGMTAETGYRLRARDAEFAELWDMALNAARLIAIDERAQRRAR